MTLGFADIHCHILPNVDDGARSLTDALEMAEMASKDGIQTLAATPHASDEYPPLPAAELLQRVSNLQLEIDRLGIPLRIVPGADVHICESLAVQVQQRRVLTLADTGRYLLLELPHDIYIPIDGLLDDLQAMGTRVILTHPERNGSLQGRLDVLEPLVQRGCLIQVTAGSILGEFGRDPRTTALRLLKHRLVHFVATDAHSPTFRKPLLQEAYQVVCASTDERYADQIFKHFPATAIEGKPLTVPPPRPLTRPLFARLFGSWS
jgi:protein-tyrosine phosphatase